MDFVSRYISACELLPARLRSAALAADDSLMRSAEELRLRTGQPMSAVTPLGEVSFDCTAVTATELVETLSRAARGSLHSFADELAYGYITAAGGHRVGVCGRSVEADSRTTVRDFSSLALRIAKEVRGAADGVFDAVFGRSTLILSPPGGGKTTLLRELVRRTSDAGLRVAVADERGEIAAYSGANAGFDVGRCTDVLTAAPKAYAALTLLRAMNPQVLALDEVTAPEDFSAVLRASGCGAAVLATMHARSIEEAATRPGVSQILRVFEKVVTIERRGSERIARAEDMPQFGGASRTIPSGTASIDAPLAP